MKRQIRCSMDVRGKYIDEINGKKVYWDESTGQTYIYTEPHGKGRMEFPNRKEAIQWLEENELSDAIISSVSLAPKAAKKIYEAEWGYDAVDVALDYTSGKCDGYDGYGDSFDVSYQGTADELRDEIFEILKSAGLPVEYEGHNKITYDNYGSEVIITVTPLPEGVDYTFTENSIGYGVFVEEILE